MLQWVKKKSSVKKTAILCGIVFVVGFFIFGNKVSAQSISDASSSLREGLSAVESTGLPSTDIRVIVAKVIKAALGLLGVVVLVLTIYAGFLWMTAGGNEEQITKAKKMMLNSAIGLAIILSAYALVVFVARMLGVGAGGDGGDVGGSAMGVPVIQNFSGSGALGRIVKDHYPARDQVDVPRNAKIVITFGKPILPETFLDDTNRDGIFGSCNDPINNWAEDCDRVKTSFDKLSDNFINIQQVDAENPIAGAVVLAASSTANGISGIYTLVIKPIIDPSVPSGGYMGSSTQRISYKVRLGGEIKLDDPANGNPSAFQSAQFGSNYYEWQFSNGTALDAAPPRVESVFPPAGSTEAMNSILQIHFSEPIDPTGIQGKFVAGDNEFFIEGQNIFLKSGSSEMPPGNFILTNNYRTLEFVSTKECGKNSCGNKIFCLPVCDKSGADCEIDNYEILLRAAKVFNESSFEGRPFTGIMDMAGNSLDGSKDNKPDTASTEMPAFPNQKQPDNYFWSFRLENRLDTSAPYLQKIMPGKDAQNVQPDQELSLQFNKRMRVDSMYGIGIQEYPAPTNGVPVWKVPVSVFNAKGTYTRINHGPFLDDRRQYYMPIVDSGVEDVHYNCFYPGKGPNQEANSAGESSECDEANPDNCCQVITQQNQAFCCNGLVSESASTAQACFEYLRSVSI